MEPQTRPSAIVRPPEEMTSALVEDCSVAELLNVALARLDWERGEILGAYGQEVAGPIAREFSLAVTHIEDAITRANKGHYRQAGIFAITDAERTSPPGSPTV